MSTSSCGWLTAWLGILISMYFMYFQMCFMYIHAILYNAVIVYELQMDFISICWIF